MNTASTTILHTIVTHTGETDKYCVNTTNTAYHSDSNSDTDEADRLVVLILHTTLTHTGETERQGVLIILQNYC